VTITPLPETDDVLDRLADTMTEIVAEDDGPALAVGVRRDGDDVELAIRSLPGHPASDLLGYSAPAEWWAFGLAARGTARPWPDGEGPGTDPEPGVLGARLTLVYIVTRDDRTLARFTVDGRPTTEIGSDGIGAIPDTCRRVLGLSTDPPTESPLGFHARCWLDAVVASCDADATWPQVARCHPAVNAVASSDDPISALAADHVGMIGRLAARVRGWEDLRLEWSQDTQGGLGLTAAEMRWMDEGMFSRWCLGSAAPLAVLLERCTERLPERHVRRVRAVLDEWGLS
jgi:hypothetical protein